MKRSLLGVFLVCLAVVSFARIDLEDKSFQRSQRSCQSEKFRENYDENFKGPFIVHLHSTHTHDDFERNVRQLQDDQYPFIAQYKAVVSHRYHSVLHGVAIEGITKKELEKLPGVKKVVADSIKKILSPLDRSYSNNIQNLANFEKSNPSVRSALPPPIKNNSKISIFPPWGIDRLNNPSLPLDKKYKADFTGKDVDVFIVDTGIDTTHSEFKQIPGGHVRTVKNIYDYYGGSGPVGKNIDTEGHGTHVAGTVGGRNTGVSPNCNMYGLKVLNDKGEGTVSVILGALDFILKFVRESGRRSVVSMSLGGPCEVNDCSEDSLVSAVASVTSANIAVSVAAGNEGCNACRGSPNSAPSAINVGATDINDKVAYFSDIGSCIDVFAPGFDILSVCASNVCKDSTSYMVMSGTSMACPHATGVVAQLLEKNPKTTVAELQKALTCDAAKNLLRPSPQDSISRNLMLQVPKNGTGYGTCKQGEGCPSECSGKGICLPVRIDHKTAVTTTYLSPPVHYNTTLHRTPNYIPSTTLVCHCDTGSYGPSCTLSSPPLCLSSSSRIKLQLTDSFGDGWTFAQYSLTDADTGLIVDGAFDSLCGGKTDTRTYCVGAGNYSLDLSTGFFPQEISWKMCGTAGPRLIWTHPYTRQLLVRYCFQLQYGQLIVVYKGGAPFSGLFNVNKKGECKQVCWPGDQSVALKLYDTSKTGWDGAYYNIYAQTGLLLYGGGLPDGLQAVNHLCLKRGKCFTVMMRVAGSYPDSLSYEICGYKASYLDVVSVCLTDTGVCTAKALTGKTCPNAVNIYMFDTSNKGWRGSYYEIKTDDKGDKLLDYEMDYKYSKNGIYENDNNKQMQRINMVDSTLQSNDINYSNTKNTEYGINEIIASDVVVARGTLDSGFQKLDSLCGLKGCYRFSTHLDYSTADQMKAAKINASTSFFSACGYRGIVPMSAPLCVDESYNACYGVTGCPVLKSHAHRTSYLEAFFSNYDISGIEVMHTSVALHGVKELCGFPSGCYNVAVTGKNDADGLFDLCGTQSTAPSMGKICIAKNVYNNTVCSSNTVKTLTCPLPSGGAVKSTPLILIKFDGSGMGWDSEVKYIIKEYNKKTKLYSGTLKDGQFGVDNICLAQGKCYSFDVTDGYRVGNSLWALCGIVGEIPIANLKFCVTESGCKFQDLDDAEYNKVQDDDWSTARRPSSSPTIFHPIAAPAPTAPTPGSDTAVGGNTTTSRVVYTSLKMTMYLQINPEVQKRNLMDIAADLPGDEDGSISYYKSDRSVFINFPEGNFTVSKKELTFVKYAVHRVLDLYGVSVWDVSAVPLSVTKTPSSSSSSSYSRPLLSIEEIDQIESLTHSTAYDTAQELEMKKEKEARIEINKQGVADVLKTTTSAPKRSVLQVMSEQTTGNRLNKIRRELAKTESEDTQKHRKLTEIVTVTCRVDVAVKVVTTSAEEKDDTNERDAKDTSTTKSTIDQAMYTSFGMGELQTLIIEALYTLNKVSGGQSIFYTTKYKISNAEIVKVLPSNEALIKIEKNSDKPVDSEYTDLFKGGSTDAGPSRFGPDGPMSTTAAAALSSLVTLLVMFVLLFAYHVCIRSRSSSRSEQPYNPLDVSTSAATVRDVKGEPISPLGIPDEGQGYANGRTDKYGNKSAVTRFSYFGKKPDTNSAPSEVVTVTFNDPPPVTMRNEILKLPNPKAHSSQEVSSLDGEINPIISKSNLSTNPYLNKIKETNTTDGKDWWVRNERKAGDNGDDNVGNHGDKNQKKSGNLDDFSYDEKVLNEEFAANNVKKVVINSSSDNSTVI